MVIRLRPLLILILMLVLLGLALHTPNGPAQATGAKKGLASPEFSSPQTNSTFLIGDSTSWRLTGKRDGGPNLFLRRDPDWHLNAVGGRSVVKLPSLIQTYLSAVDPAPRTFIMALGTNTRAEWQSHSYADALSLLPPETSVVLVIPIRAGSNKGEKGKAVARNARWLYALARTRPNTVVADWRSTVLQDPTLDPVTGRSRLLAEGIHQTRHGRLVWMRVVEAAVKKVS